MTDPLATAALATPYLELDISAAVRRYLQLADLFPGVAIHYAVKANPHPRLLTALSQVGCRFDVASPAEVDAARAAGSRPEAMVYSNPVKRRDHVAQAHSAGVRLFVVDSASEVAKVAQAAPGSAVLVRLLTSGAGSDWALSRKFGVTEDEAVTLLVAAKRAGLQAAGVAFHVGSQQRDPRAWVSPVAQAANIFRRVARYGLSPWLVDLGGGLPAHHAGAHEPLDLYAASIWNAVRRTFGGSLPDLILEPGRGLVGDAGTVVSSVIGIVHRGGRRWVFLDAGIFTGLVETLDEAIRYRLETTAFGPVGPCVLAGPTCDSADVLYEKVPVDLPLSLAEGDQVRFASAGAYTSCYSTVGFNGFAPLPTHVVSRARRAERLSALAV
jgi:ornithine decarboxylase